MPLCTGVRPTIEDMPQKDSGAFVQLFTSNTTAPILDIVNHVPVDAQITRDDLENSLMRTGYLSSVGRTQLLDALYGVEPNPKDFRHRRRGHTGDPQDLDRFFRQHLGSKVVKCWTSGQLVHKGCGLAWENEGNEKAYLFPYSQEDPTALAKMQKDTTPDYMKSSLKKVGSFDPTEPDKRGPWKPVDDAPWLLATHREKPAPIQEANELDLLAPTAPTSASPHLVASKGQAKKSIDSEKSRKAVAALTDQRIRPNAAMGIIKESLKLTFEVCWIQIDRFTLSLGELVAAAKFGLPLHIPSQTEIERAYFDAFQGYCRSKLEELVRCTDLNVFQHMVKANIYKKEYLEVMQRLLEAKSAWQSMAVKFLSNFARKIQRIISESEQKSRFSLGRKKEPSREFQRAASGQTQRIQDDLLRQMQENNLDPEWHKRIDILRKRDRKFLKEELELFFEDCLVRKREPSVREETEIERQRMRVLPPKQATSPKHVVEAPKPDAAKVPDTPAADPRTIGASPASDLHEKKKPKPLEGITKEMLLDSPRYWFDHRLEQGGGVEEKPFTLKQKRALKEISRSSEDFILRHGKHGKEEVSAKMLAAKALHRADQMHRHDKELYKLNYLEFVQEAAGIVPGKVLADDTDIKGAARGSCFYRLVPSYEKHEDERTSHPTLRPPAARIKTFQEFQDIQNILKKPHIDGNGKFDGDGPRLHRPPTATPRQHRMRIQQRQEAQKIQEKLRKQRRSSVDLQQDFDGLEPAAWEDDSSAPELFPTGEGSVRSTMNLEIATSSGQSASRISSGATQFVGGNPPVITGRERRGSVESVASIASDPRKASLVTLASQSGEATTIGHSAHVI